MDLPFLARAALTVVFTASGVYCLLRCARWSPLRRIAARAGEPRTTAADTGPARPPLASARPAAASARPAWAIVAGAGPAGTSAAGMGQPQPAVAGMGQAQPAVAGSECMESGPDGEPGAGCHDSGNRHGRLVDLAQVAMSVAMVAMLVTGVRGDRWGAQATLFAVAGTWFLTRALPALGRRTHPADARTGLVNHAVMMGGMVWMSVATSRVAAPMDMAGRAALGPATVTSLAIAAYLAAASVWWGRRSLVTAGSGGFFGATGATTCHAVTSAAMATVFVLSIHA